MLTTRVAAARVLLALFVLSALVVGYLGYLPVSFLNF
jgi:hypothetical protein